MNHVLYSHNRIPVCVEPDLLGRAFVEFDDKSDKPSCTACLNHLINHNTQ